MLATFVVVGGDHTVPDVGHAHRSACFVRACVAG